MATAASVYTWATYGTPLKAYLGVSGTAEDTTLQLLLESAAQDCDDFVGAGAFTDDDDLDITHPIKIKLGIYEWVKAFRAFADRAVGLSGVTTGGWSESYANGSGSLGMLTASRAARMAASALWTASVADVSLMGV